MVGFALVLLGLARRYRVASKDPEFRVLALVTALLLAVGTAFYSNVEGWSILDSLYFCVITLATVGYGDFAPHTALGKIFTILYVLLGIGVIVAFADKLVRSTPRHGDTSPDASRHDAAGQPRT
jgi:hypothetical protein